MPSLPFGVAMFVTCSACIAKVTVSIINNECNAFVCTLFCYSCHSIVFGFLFSCFDVNLSIIGSKLQLTLSLSPSLFSLSHSHPLSVSNIMLLTLISDQHCHQYIIIVNFIIVSWQSMCLLADVFYVLACRLARTDCKNRQMPKISILE